MLNKLRLHLLQVKIFPRSVALMVDHLLLVSDMFYINIIIIVGTFGGRVQVMFGELPNQK